MAPAVPPHDAGGRRPATDVVAWVRRRMVAHGDVEGFGYSAAPDAPLQLQVGTGADPAAYPSQVGGWPIELFISDPSGYRIVAATGPEVADPSVVEPVVD